MKREEYDIAIAGAGIAGLIATACFARAGFHVLTVDPKPPVIDPLDANADLRSTAFLRPARDLLIRAGVWERLAPFAQPLEVMRLADAGGAENEIRYLADFNATEIGEQAFAWNIPNWRLRRELDAEIRDTGMAEIAYGAPLGRMTQRNDHILSAVQDRLFAARLLIGADGRHSPTRINAQIDVSTTRYGQKALAFTIRHSDAHHNISTEIHRSGGPFTLVPLPDRDGQPHSAVVWMERATKAAVLFDLDEPAFNAVLNERSCGVLGDIQLASRRTIWPIISQKARALTAPRIALVAEAAHVVPPIGAQGLNMSLADIECLLDVAVAAPDALGHSAQLGKYERSRLPDISLRHRGIDMLNRAALSESAGLRDLRLAGLKFLHQTAPIRKSLMTKGLGRR